MKHIKFLKSRVTIIVLILVIIDSCSQETDQNEDNYAVDALVSWNQKVLELAVEEDGLLTLKGVRTAAMMHLAIHDALNSINPRYQYYVFQKEVKNADPLAAAAQAAYEVASKQYANSSDILLAELNLWLDQVNDEKAKAAGVKLGKLAAAEILENRNNDNYNGEAAYTWHPMGPGVYAEFNEHSGTPEGFVFGAGWAAAKPFMLKSQDQFRSPPPPEISSEAYAEAFTEVKEFGSFESAKRSADQAHLAMWWKDFVENSHNKLARELVTKEGLNMWEAGRVFALLNMTIYDAYVNVFDNKFHYNHWRPYTAIRWAANDGNPNTKADTSWNNLHQHTYAFPSYPSAHGTASTAAMISLSQTLGVGDNYPFEMTTETVDKAGPFSGKLAMDPPTRSFNSFSEAGMEAAMSRVYLGIHFRYDSEEGFELGKKIGTYGSENYLLPLDID